MEDQLELLHREDSGADCEKLRHEHAAQKVPKLDSEQRHVADEIIGALFAGERKT